LARLAGGIEGVGDMAGHFPGRHQDHVETDIAARVIRVMSKPKLRSGNDPALAALGQRVRRFVGPFARLDLDKNEGVAAAGDDIDLAQGVFSSAGPRSDSLWRSAAWRRGFPPTDRAGTPRRARVAARPAV
jgi:hypothetical protein